MQNILEYFTRTGDAVWAVDADYRILLWNAAAEELLGYSAEEASGQTCYELLGGCDLDGNPVCGAECPIADSTEQGLTVDAFDMQIRRNDGRFSLLNVSIIAVPDTSGLEAGAGLVHLCRPIANGKRPFAPPLRIHLLGHLMVQRADGSPVEGNLWRQSAVQAILAYLAFQRGKPVHRDSLVKALWPDLSYSVALKRLTDTIHDLRTSLEPEAHSSGESRYVHYEADHFTLNGSQLHWLDVEAFEKGITQARQELNLGQAIALYREALALYRGDLLADLDPDLLIGNGERERLRELYLAGLEELASLCTQSPDPTYLSTALSTVRSEPVAIGH